jgi:hypothetical protein
MEPIQVEEPGLGEEGISSPSRGFFVGDLPESLGTRRQEPPLGTSRGEIPILGPAMPSSNPLPNELVVEWRRSPKAGASGVSAATLGVLGSSLLTTRAVLFHPWPETRRQPSPHEPVTFRFAVTVEGRVKRVIPETLGDPTWVQTASECLLRWRFAPVPNQKDGETWGRIRL